MYTRVLDFGGGELRLVFFARTDIAPGQELTYDYRFKEEEGDAKVPCKCGAPNCRGWLN
jgi:NuA3 HAT complex component NTO1